MARNYFGTDGIRGTANSDPMTAEVALRVGMAAGRVFTRGAHRHSVVIGKDTRLSGYMLEPALAAGFVSMGMDVIFVGPMPTPAVAMLTRSLRADLGVVISASHNPFYDNGIKLFGPDGYKLSDETEEQIERLVESNMQDHLAQSGDLGRARRLEDAEGRYIEFVKNTFPKGRQLEGLKIVVDCANGAAYKVAPTTLWELGAEVVTYGVEPDGFNINKDCGSTDTYTMCQMVREHGADIGIALDGDADRVLIADETGNLLDGDLLMAIVAESWQRRGKLNGGGIVATVMSNLGLENYLRDIGLTLERTQVGDRYVVDHMRANGFNVGGEQSGHIVLSDYNTTGDGLIAAIEVLSALEDTGNSVSELGRRFQPYPQILENVRFKGNSPLENKTVKEAVDDGESRLRASGRILVRKSGTEPLIRVMAEGADQALVQSVVADIVTAIEQVSN
ncbi:MAG: phosphoglucosamine mutase [Pseudomonadota bacterium]|nr:phosphoglucosamine mutase [Pseudomonadota bacterium]MEC8725422.1 phosphoglucosamine mutase [Pseudomonadota bacterium]